MLFFIHSYVNNQVLQKLVVTNIPSQKRVDGECVEKQWLKHIYKCPGVGTSNVLWFRPRLIFLHSIMPILVIRVKSSSGSSIT